MRHKCFRIITICTLLLMAGMVSSTHIWAMDHYTKILSMDDNGFEIEVTLPPFELEDVFIDGEKYQSIILRKWAKTSDAGFPELPFNGIMIQAPPSGKIWIDVTESVYKSVLDCQICPVLKRTIGGDLQYNVKFVRNDGAYNSRIFFPERFADIDSRGMLRDLSVARVKIYPFQWNPATGELRYYQKLRLRVRFEKPLQREKDRIPGRGEVFERVAEKTIINYKNREKIGRKRHAELDESSGPGKEALKIEVKQDGIYRITYDALVRAGLRPRQIAPSTYRLFNKGDEVSIKVVLKRKRRGKFTRGSFIEFYGQGMDNFFTDSNTYWLQWEEGKEGKRIVQVDGKETGQGEMVDSFQETIRFEENHENFGLTPGAPNEDSWFWQRLTGPSSDEFELKIPSVASNQDNATLRVGFQGRSTAPPDPNHHIIISLNGTQIGETFWNGDEKHSVEFSVSADLLNEGTNTLGIELPGDTGAAVDVVYFNWVDVRYSRRLEVEEDNLRFTINGNDNADNTLDENSVKSEIINFSNRDVIIYDISDPLEVKEIVNFTIQPDGLNSKVIFNDTISADSTYHVLTADKIRIPDNLTLWQPANLKDRTNGADYIVVTAGEFIPAVDPLIKHHQDNGLRVKAVSVDDIFNEFNHGIFDPAAIKDFLRFAFENWEEPAPTYVLFAGDANGDYRDYLGQGKKNKAPVHLSTTKEIGLTPDDTWYVSVKGDDLLPDMLVGRISGDSAEKVSEVINKIVRFTNSDDFRPKSVLFVADDDRKSFETLNEELAEILSPGFGSDKVYLSTFDEVEDATEEIISNIEKGELITNYVGHGSVTNWSNKTLFKTSNIRSLDNDGRLPFVITLNCLNGFFSQPSNYSLGEEFVMAKDKGAIACFSSSTLGFEWEHNILNKEIFSSIFNEGNDILGLICTESKIDAFAKGITPDTMISFTLFGDPAGKLKIGD